MRMGESIREKRGLAWAGEVLFNELKSVSNSMLCTEFQRLSIPTKVGEESLCKMPPPAFDEGFNACLSSYPRGWQTLALKPNPGHHLLL